MRMIFLSGLTPAGRVWLTTEHSMQLHELTCDVLVAGGGPSGVPCALAAARCGAKVILVHDRPVLGGNASSEIRMHIVGADGGRVGSELTEARETGIIEEIRLENAVRNGQSSASMMDLILYDLCRSQPNLTVLFNTTLESTTVVDRSIRTAKAVRHSTEDEFIITASVFVDCTGDGRMALEAGATFRTGREAKHEFNEPQAMDVADNKTLGSTLLIMARDTGAPAPFVAPKWARPFAEKDLLNRGHSSSFEYGYWWIEWGGELNTIKDNEAIRDELAAIVMGVWDHIKNSGDHGAANWALDWIGFLPGKRESRRFLGQRVLNENDVLNSTAFADAIAFGGWPIDLHPPEGVDAPEKKPCYHTHLKYLYDIPLSCCVSADVNNLMFAGRNISATHVAFASTRVMATCAVMGQGVGTAAAFAVSHKIAPAKLSTDAASMRSIQQRLLRDDAFLIGVSNEDSHDLARAAAIVASSEQPEGPSANVTRGPTRRVDGPRVVSPERAVAGTNRWMSDPSAGLPAWLELRWPQVQRIGSVQLIFDTGLHRALTLTFSTPTRKNIIWGKGQTETVRDYAISALDARGNWSDILVVNDNHQRRRVHEFSSPIMAVALRLRIETTQGLDHARVCEVRVYGPDTPHFI
jgi:hypothetical protein